MTLSVSERDRYVIECHEMGLSNAQIGRDLGISRERVRQILQRTTGSSTPLPLQHGHRRQLALIALEALETGQKAPAVAQGLQLSERRLDGLLREQFGLNQRRVEFEGWMADQIGRRCQDWTILAIEPEHARSQAKHRCRVTARCERCQNRYQVGIRNLIEGNSNCCLPCSCKAKKDRHQFIKELISASSSSPQSE